MSTILSHALAGMFAIGFWETIKWWERRHQLTLWHKLLAMLVLAGMVAALLAWEPK